MSDQYNIDEKAIVPSGRQELITRSSGLAKRGLESIAAQQIRIIHFPTDRSMGQIWITDTESRFFMREVSVGFASWPPKEFLSEAIGTVTVPREKYLTLDVSEEASVDISPLAQLNSNDLDGIRLPWNYYTVGDAGLVHIVGLTSLKLLWLDFGNISDTGLSLLKVLTSLQSLSLIHTYISDAGLAHLKELPSLKYLYLGMNNISDTGLASLVGLSSLKDLSLLSTKISDAGLAYLSGLTSLEELNLNRTKISDAGLDYLCSLTSLKKLQLWRTLVSETGVVYLRKMLPKTDIFM